MNGYFVTGTDTGVGKTVVAAIMVQALRAAYWKPIQCGDLHVSDSDYVRRLTPDVKLYPETYRFALPASPHAAAAAENKEIDLESLKVLKSVRTRVVVEGAGGVMVPLNSQHLMLDLMSQLELPVILVSRHYLGSINHTLLSIAALKSRGISIAGIIFNGVRNHETEDAIAAFGKVKILGHVPWTECVDKAFIANQVKEMCWNDLI